MAQASKLGCANTEAIKLAARLRDGYHDDKASVKIYGIFSKRYRPEA
jgi:hypothetical protein